MQDKIILIKKRREISRQIRNLKRIDPKHARLKILRKELRRISAEIKKIGFENIRKVSNLANYI